MRKRERIGTRTRTRPRARGLRALLALGLALSLVMGIAASAWAQGDDEEEEEQHEFAHPGIYVAAQGVYAIDLFESAIKDEVAKSVGPAFKPFVRTKNSFGVNGRVGYRMHKNVAVEGEFQFLNDYPVESPGGIRIGRIQSWDATGNVKGYLLTGRVQPYVLAGVGWGQADVKSGAVTCSGTPPLAYCKRLDTNPDGFVARFGGGVDLYADRKLGVTLEASYLLPTGSLRKIDYVSIGIGFFVRYYAD